MAEWAIVGKGDDIFDPEQFSKAEFEEIITRNDEICILLTLTKPCTTQVWKNQPIKNQPKQYNENENETRQAMFKSVDVK